MSRGPASEPRRSRRTAGRFPHAARSARTPIVPLAILTVLVLSIPLVGQAQEGDPGAAGPSAAAEAPASTVPERPDGDDRGGSRADRTPDGDGDRDRPGKPEDEPRSQDEGRAEDRKADPVPDPSAAPRETAPEPEASDAPEAPPSREPGPSIPAEASAAPTPTGTAPNAKKERRRRLRQADADTRPDIIVVIVDDLGYIPDDRILARLPHIRDLWLDGGVRFEQMYGQTPLCCPAWATMLTGRSTLGHGVTTNDGDLFDPSDTIAVDLQDAGYHTLLVGKYLTSYSGTRQPPGWDRVAMSGAKHRSIFSVDGVALSYAPQHHDHAVRRVARDWLRSAPADRPVFAMIGPRAPHRQPGACKRCRFLPTVRKQDRKAPECQGIPSFRPPSYSLTQLGPAGAWKMPTWPNGWPMRRICESLVVVDRMVGQLVDAQAKRERPAWFVLLSDNGMAWGQKGFPLKRVPGSTRLPFYVAGPGVPAGEASEALVTNLDIFPTLRDMAGLSSSGGAGRSLLPIASDPRRVGHDEVLELMPAGGPAAFVEWAAVRTPDWHFIRWFSGLRELYDMRSDPWELDDLMAERPGVASDLEARLDEMLEASSGGP